MTRKQLVYIALAVMAIIVLAVSCSAQAARCDGNQGNGKGNICEPASQPASPHTTQTNRQYIERVHSYAHGNSLGIQALRRTTNAIEKVNVRQDADIAAKVDTTTFEKDQARQDKAVRSVAKRTGKLESRADQTDIDVKHVQKVNTRQDATLATHGDRLDGHDAQLAGYADVNAALNTRLGGAYQRLDNHEGRISNLERNMDRNNEAAAIGLAIAGHQFDTKGGFQTAVSIATVNSREALAVGMGGALSERVFVNAGIASSGNTTGGVVSSTYSW